MLLPRQRTIVRALISGLCQKRTALLFPLRAGPFVPSRTMRARRPSGQLKKIFERGVSVRKYEQPDRYVDAARSLNNLPSMFRREYICIEVGNPLLAFLGDSQVAQSISDIRLHDLPIKMRIICP